MTKRIIASILILLLCTLLLSCGADKAETKTVDTKALTKITLNEVTHSLFYAPLYVAIEEGYFEDVGLDLTLENGFGADKTMASVLSGEAQIGFCGAEASIYAYGEGAPIINLVIAQLYNST